MLEKNEQVFTGVNGELYDGKIMVIRRYKTTKFEGFEFQIEGTILVDVLNEIEADYFRYECHANGDQYIVVAERDPEYEGYYIFEDATCFFDVDAIDKECRNQFTVGDIPDESIAYLEFCAEEESSW